MRQLLIALGVLAFMATGFISKPSKKDLPLEQIPYTGELAKSDIDQGLVRIIDLISPTHDVERTRVQDLVGPDQLMLVEQELGFTFQDILLDDIAPKYLSQREAEYNAVVYAYLDKKLDTSAKDLIRSKIIGIYKEQRTQNNLLGMK